MTSSLVPLCHVLLCHHCTCVHFRRARESQVKRCLHICHHIGWHRFSTAHTLLTHDMTRRHDETKQPMHRGNRRLPTLPGYICGRCRHTAGELRAHLTQDLPIGHCENLRYKIFNDKKATAKQRQVRYKCVLLTFYTSTEEQKKARRTHVPAAKRSRRNSATHCAEPQTLKKAQHCQRQRTPQLGHLRLQNL